MLLMLCPRPYKLLKNTISLITPSQSTFKFIKLQQNYRLISYIIYQERSKKKHMNYHLLNQSHHTRVESSPAVDRFRQYAPHMEPRTQPRPLRPNRTFSKNGNSELYPSNQDASFYMQRPPNYCLQRKPRRPSEAMCTLKSELATLKEEIGKLISVDDQFKQDSRRQSFGNYSLRAEDKYAHEGSTATLAQSILFNPQRELSMMMRPDENPEYERNRHLILENESLKLEIEKLQARLTFQQGDYTQQIHSMTLKMHHLESLLTSAHAQQTLLVDEEVHQLRQELSTVRERELNNREIEASLQEIIKARDAELRGKQMQITNITEELERVVGCAERDVEERKLKADIYQLREALQARETEIREMHKRGNHQIEDGQRAKEEVQKIKQEMNRVRRVLQVRQNEIKEMQRIIKNHGVDKDQMKKISEALQQKESELRQLKAQKHSEGKQLLQKGIFDKQQITNLQSMLNQRDYELKELIEYKQKSMIQRQEMTRLKESLQNSEADLRKLQHLNTKQITETKRSQMEEKDQLRRQLQNLKLIADNKQKQLQVILNLKQEELRVHNSTASSQLSTLENIVKSLKQELSVTQMKTTEQQKLIMSQQNEIRGYSEMKANQANQANQEILISKDLKVQLENMKRIAEAKELESGRVARELQIKVDKMKDELSNVQKQLQSKVQLLKASQQDLSKSQDSIKYLNSQIQVLANGKSQSQKLASQVSNLNQHFESHIQHLEAEHGKVVVAMNRQLEELKHTNNAALKNNSEMTLRLKSKQDQLATVRQESHKNQRSFEELTISYDISVKDNQQLHEQLNSKSQELVHIQTTLHTLQAQLAISRDNNTNLQQKLDHIESLSGRDTQQARILLEQQHSIRELQQKIHLIENQSTTVKKELGSSQVQYQEQTQQLEELERKLRSKADEMQAMEISYKRQIVQMKEEMERLLVSKRHIDQSNLIMVLEEKLKEQEKSYDTIIEDLKWSLRRRDQDDLGKSRSTMNEMDTIDEAMKGHNDQVGFLRSELTKRSNELDRLKDTLFKNNTQFTNLKSLYEIQKVKSMSEKNNSSVASQAEIQNLKHDLALERKNSESVAQKLKYLTEENKKKDAFIQNYLISKKISVEDKEQLKVFFQKYEAEFSIEKIRSNMLKEFVEIERLTKINQELTQQIAKFTKTIESESEQNTES